MIFAAIDKMSAKGMCRRCAQTPNRQCPPPKTIQCIGRERRRSPDALRSREIAKRITKQHELNPEDAHLLSRILASTEDLAGTSGAKKLARKTRRAPSGLPGRLDLA